jgi:Tn3 transposase DDE domain
MAFGLYKMLGFRFAPRFRDLNDQRFWRADLPDGDEPSGYGPLDAVACNKVNLKRIVTHWPDMLRVGGSLITNQMRAYVLLRMFGREGHPTPLGAAFAEYGRIDKTMHLLAVVDPVDDTYRRLMNRQLTVQESRHRLARAICHGGRGQIRQAYREGQEDQLAALGLVSTPSSCGTPATWMPPSPNSAPRAATSRTRTSPASPRSRTGTSISWAATFSTSRPAAPAGTGARCATRMRPSWTRTTGPWTDLGFPRLRVCHPRSLTRCASP